MRKPRARPPALCRPHGRCGSDPPASRRPAGFDCGQSPPLRMTHSSGQVTAHCLQKQIIPTRVLRLYQSCFFLTPPTFELFLSGNGILHVFKGFTIYQSVDVIPFCKALDEFCTVLIYSSRQISCNPNVQNTVARRCQNICVIHSRSLSVVNCLMSSSACNPAFVILSGA